MESIKTSLFSKDKKALVLGSGGASKVYVTLSKKLNIEYKIVSRESKVHLDLLMKI